MRKVRLLIADHELERGGIGRVFGRIGIFQQHRDVLAVVQGAYLDVFHGHFLNAILPVDLRRQGELGLRGAVPGGGIGIVQREGILGHHGADGDAFLGQAGKARRKQHREGCAPPPL